MSFRRGGVLEAWARCCGGAEGAVRVVMLSVWREQRGRGASFHGGVEREEERHMERTEVWPATSRATRIPTLTSQEVSARVLKRSSIVLRDQSLPQEGDGEARMAMLCDAMRGGGGAGWIEWIRVMCSDLIVCGLARGMLIDARLVPKRSTSGERSGPILRGPALGRLLDRGGPSATCPVRGQR